MTSEELNYIINNEEAYKQFYIGYFRKLYNYGRKFTDNTAHVEDAIQEVFLDLWVNTHKLKNIQSVNSYLFSSFRYILLRRLKGESKIISTESFQTEAAFSIDYAIIEQESNTELQAKLKNAMETLTPRQREAIFLRFYQNLSYEEVAAILNISVKATYKIMARSLAALKENMPGYLAVLLMLVGLNDRY